MNNRYVLGILWSLGACGISACNDVLCKFLGSDLPGPVVLFLRFFFSMIFLLPFFLKNPSAFKTKRWDVHAIRGGLFALGMFPWTYGLIVLSLPLMTMLSFTTPLFIIILARFFLFESVGWQRALATGLGFAGICVSVGLSSEAVPYHVWIALLATLLFATLDIVNKRLLVLNEGLPPMMLFSAFWTSLFTAPLAWYSWVAMPSLSQMGLLMLLGINANIMLLCLLKASRACDLSSLQPLRYTEFIFSCLLSVIFFQQWPTKKVLWGMSLIIPSTLYLSHHELNLDRKKKKNMEKEELS